MKIDESKVRVTFNERLSDKQIEAGIVAKATIIHPAFTTRATIRENNSRLYVFGSSVQSNNGNNSEGENNNNSGGTWFNIVSLEQAFRNYIIEKYKEFKEGKMKARDAWYLQEVGKHAPIPTASETSEELDILGLTIVTNLSDDQINSGIVAKVNMKTSIADVRGITVYRSMFGESLYLQEQAEDKDRKIPGYRLTKEAEVQILSYLHSLVTDWGEPPTPKERKSTNGKSIEETVEKLLGEGERDPIFNEDRYFG
jgi:hypothetical protein